MSKKNVELNTACKATFKDGYSEEYISIEEASEKTGLSIASIKIRCNKPGSGGKDKTLFEWCFPRGVIYCYTNKINNKKYVGQTINEVGRKRKFKNGGSLYTSNSEHLTKIDKARIKYGVDKFNYLVLEEIQSPNRKLLQEELDKLECYYITLLDSYNNGYNETSGGSGNLNRIISKETRQKISKSLKGHSVSNETREKMRIAAMGNSNMKNKHHSEETKQLISIKHKGKQIGKNNPYAKSVICYSKDMVFIKEFSAISEACDWLNISTTCTSNITACCKGNKKSAYKYIWRYGNEK